MGKYDNAMWFAVGTSERHGPAWVVYNTGKQDDIYVGTTGTDGELKASLHDSGDFRVAFTQEHARSDRALVKRRKRVIARWKPLDIAAGVWCLFSVRQPWSSVNMSYALDPHVRLVPGPTEGFETVASVYAANRNVRVNFDAQVIGSLTLPTGATAWVRVTECQIPDDAVVPIHDRRKERDGHIRAFLPGTDQWGVGFIREFGNGGV
jgi:hypothetical protein